MSKPNPRTASISVDFGTSHTVASIRRADGRVHQQLFDGSPQLPSAVFMNDEGGPVVGSDAVHHGRRKPERYEPNPKRRIDDGTILLGEQELPVTSVIAAVLSRVARECEQTLGGLGPATVTVPAAWGPTRRHVVADAATAAGLGNVALVPEPVAAAGYFVETLGNDVPLGAGVVVYDLGGGTFDATVLRRAPAGFDVLAVDGADDLGGLDFDQVLAEHLAGSVQPEDERWTRLTAPADQADKRHRTVFLDEVRQAKERLSRNTSTDLTIPLLDIDAHLTRDELETVAAPLLERTVRITQGAIRESGLAKEQIAGMFLVGAASRMPLAATMLHRELGIAPAAIEQPELAVSEGGLVAQALASSPPAPVPSPALPPQMAPHTSPMPTRPVATPPHMTGPMRSPQPVLPAAAPGPHGFGAWVKTKRGMTTIGAAGLAIVLAVATVVALNFLPDDKGNENAAEGAPVTEASSGQAEEESAGAGSPVEDEPVSSGEESDTVDFASAEPGDRVAAMAGAHTGAVTYVRTARLDGKDVALTSGADGFVHIWDLETGERLDTYRKHGSEINTLAVTEHDDRPVVFSQDGEAMHVWYLDDPETTVSSRDAEDSLTWIGQWDSVPAYADTDEVMQMFTGNQMFHIQNPYLDRWAVGEVDGSLRTIGHHENRVIVAAIETGESVGGTFDQLTYEITWMIWGEVKGTYLAVTATGDGSIQAWDLVTAEQFGTTASDPVQTVYGMQLAELDGRTAVLLWGSKGLSLFDLETGEPIIESFAEHSGEDELKWATVAEVDGHPVAVTGSGTGTVEVWSL